MNPQRVELRFPGTRDRIAPAFADFRRVLDAEQLVAAPRYHAELVFDEIVSNIVRHGAPPGGELAVCVTVELRPEAIVLTFEDDGVPFDPRVRKDPAPRRSLEDAKAGGSGLMLVRRAASSLDYLRTADGRNRLTVRVARREQGA